MIDDMILKCMEIDVKSTLIDTIHNEDLRDQRITKIRRRLKVFRLRVFRLKVFPVLSRATGPQNGQLLTGTLSTDKVFLSI